MFIQSVELQSQVCPGCLDAPSRMIKPEHRGAPKDPALINALTIIAHDLRGPLANLSLLIELIETHAHMRTLDSVTAVLPAGAGNDPGARRPC